MRAEQYREHRIELQLEAVAVLPEQQYASQSLRNPA